MLKIAPERVIHMRFISGAAKAAKPLRTERPPTRAKTSAPCCRVVSRTCHEGPIRDIHAV